MWEQWPADWFVGPLRNYAVLKPGTDVDQFQAKLHTFAHDHLIPNGREKVDLYLQQGPRMHLCTKQDYGVDTGGGFDEPSGNIDRVYAVMGIGTLVLILACLNYVNLITSQADVRSREVGLQKVSGASRRHLMYQFVGESILTSTVTFGIALALADQALPWIGSILDEQLSLSALSWPLLIGSLMVAIPTVALLATVYPAIILSGHQPIESLSGKGFRRSSGKGLRQTLVVVQFCASIALIIGTIVVHNQIVYIQNKDLGFEKERIITLPFFLRDRAMWEKIDAIKTEITNIAGVESATAVHHRPGQGESNFSTVRSQDGSPEGHKMTWGGIDEDFRIDLVGGQNISRNDFRTISETERETSVLLNETAAKLVGWTPGSTTTLYGEWGWRYSVNGILPDYHNQSLHSGITRLMLNYSTNPKIIYARLTPGNLPQTIAQLERVWKAFLPDRPFEYTFLDDHFDTFYRSEMVLRQIVSFFSVLAIVVGCLGTLGLVTYSARRRRKEMGIRKTLGADADNVIYLLSREFMILVLAAFCVASPIAYYFCADWLNAFAYRIDVPLAAFVIGGAVTFILVALSITVQTIWASREVPVEALRYE